MSAVRTSSRAALFLLLALLLAARGGAQRLTAVDHGPNAPATERKHSVVLVSLDGFGWDSTQTSVVRNLLAIAAHGASGPMIPSFPTTRAPNLYTLATGLYPEHHGIVAESFYNEDHTKRFSSEDPASRTDGSWYGGTPLWVLAEQQGMRSACLFWPGSEAEIHGFRPAFSLREQDKIPNAARVDQALALLRLPEAQRPHFIALSLADVAHAGHASGPESPQTRAAVKQADAQVGRLRAGLAASRLPVDLVVVSDAGMLATEGRWISLDTYADLSKFATAGSLLYAPSDADAARTYEKLKIADANFKVYRRADVPRELHANTNPRIGDPVIVADAPVAIRAHGPGTPAPDRGSDGYDPRQFPEMRAIFYAEGPDIRAGVRLKPFENTNVFPLLAAILGLQHPPVDGSANVLASALKDAP